MDKRNRMGAIVEAYYQSGMKQKQFANSQGLSLDKLKYWVQKFKKQPYSNESFIPVKTSPITPSKALLEVHYPNGVRIQLSQADIGLLSQLIKVY